MLCNAIILRKAEVCPSKISNMLCKQSLFISLQNVRLIFIVINRWFSQHKRVTIHCVLAFLEIPELYFTFIDMHKYFFFIEFTHVHAILQWLMEYFIMFVLKSINQIINFDKNFRSNGNIFFQIYWVIEWFNWSNIYYLGMWWMN
jgi:hypothetical protein